MPKQITAVVQPRSLEQALRTVLGRRRLLQLAGLTAGAALLARLPLGSLRTLAQSFRTRNVFVVSIDGLRNTEAFEGPSHQYTPHMWNELAPRGTIYRDCKNLTITTTTAGHYNMFAGVWFAEPVTGGQLRIRPQHPTLFEYYRRANPTLRATDVWVVAAKPNVRLIDYSYHPHYGQAYAATLVEPTRDAVWQQHDEKSWAKMQEVIDTYHPSLVFFHLGEVDNAGHTGDWTIYTNAIRDADAIVADLWTKLQSDPVYQDSTMLIVTSDHGRRDDAFGGIRYHAGISEGCKRVPLLAIGPDIKQGLILDTSVEQVDIVPTIGYLMGFSTPLHEGRVLTDMIMQPAAVTQVLSSAPATAIPLATRVNMSQARAVHPTIAVNDQGVHLLWADDRDGHWEVYYRRLPLGSTVWAAEERLSNGGVQSRAPAIAADTTGVYAVWLDYRDGNWALYSRRRPPRETCPWNAEQRIATSMLEKPSGAVGAMLWEPFVAAREGKVLVCAPYWYRGVRCLWSGNKGLTWRTRQISTKMGAIQRVVGAVDGSRIDLLWNQVTTNRKGDTITNWDLAYASSVDAGLTWTAKKTLMNLTSISYHPALAAAYSLGPELHAVWADDHGGAFQIYRAGSVDGGASWTLPAPLSPLTAGAFRPDIAMTPGQLHVVWEDYGGSGDGIYYANSGDSGLTWSVPQLVVSGADHHAMHPRLASWQGQLHLVWQDDRDGEWTVYYTFGLGPNSQVYIADTLEGRHVPSTAPY